MDMLSKLPEPILCHILSFVPTKTSVACSVLSKTWKSLWTSVPVLDLDRDRDMPTRPNRFKYRDDHDDDDDDCDDDDEYCYYNKVENENKKKELRFLQIVDKVYYLRDSPVKKLRLCIQTIESLDQVVRYLEKWISACRFEELDLFLYYKDLTFPTSPHYSNMVVLKLKGLNLGSVDVCLFPKLKVLHLERIYFKDKDGASLENFLSACPILEDLLCKQLRMCDDRAFRICVPTLTSLIVQYDEDDRHHFSSKFVLETPALRYLSFQHDGTQDSLVAASLCNLSKAHIICLLPKHREPQGSFMEVLKNLCSVEFLKLSFTKMRHSVRWFTLWHGLVDGFDYSCLNELPVFDNLVRLELSIPSCDCVLLPDLLQKFPDVEHISIDKVFGIEEAEVCWKEPPKVPICLSSTLSSFYFQGFEGTKVEVELVKYVKKHAKVLKNMTLQTSSYFQEFMARAKATQELPLVPGGSEACQFHIIPL